MKSSAGPDVHPGEDDRIGDVGIVVDEGAWPHDRALGLRIRFVQDEAVALRHPDADLVLHDGVRAVAQRFERGFGGGQPLRITWESRAGGWASGRQVDPGLSSKSLESPKPPDPTAERAMRADHQPYSFRFFESLANSSSRRSSCDLSELE